jgi:acyl carrier protein
MKRCDFCFKGAENVEIKKILHKYIHETFLKGEQSRFLQYDTPLLTSGIIDSIGVLDLISFIESKFDIEFLPRELDRDRLETIDRIHDSIRAKMEAKDLPG